MALTDILQLAQQNLLAPTILFFVLGFAAGLAKSDLKFPNGMGKALSIYLMFSIGFKGGVVLNDQALGLSLIMTLLAGVALGLLIPFIAFWILRTFTSLTPLNGAAVAAHYGSVSIVTFVTAIALLELLGVPYEGYMVAVAALMETPAIISGLFLAQQNNGRKKSVFTPELMKLIFLNGSVVLLMGSFLIGMATGQTGMEKVAPFIIDPFQGVLCLFLLDMGLVASTRLKDAGGLDGRVISFAFIMPLIAAALALLAASLIGLSVGGATLLATLCASASYIVVPAAVRIALPKADPGIYITLSMALTFPFNIVIGIPLYLELAKLLIH